MKEQPDAVLVAKEKGVAVVTLNRPQSLNAMSEGLMRALDRAVDGITADDDVRAVIVSGNGKAFSAGGDLLEFQKLLYGNPQRLIETLAYNQSVFEKVERLPVPVIGAVNGTAVAGGFELLLGCDVIVASATAEFGLPEVKRGLFPAGGGTFLGTRIPLGVALELALTGDSISASRAAALGLVNVVTPPDEVLPSALALAERIAANGPLALAAVKELVRLGVTDAARARERQREWQEIVFNSEDAREGATAFVERRPPVWRGR